MLWLMSIEYKFYSANENITFVSISTVSCLPLLKSWIYFVIIFIILNSYSYIFNILVKFIFHEYKYLKQNFNEYIFMTFHWYVYSDYYIWSKFIELFQLCRSLYLLVPTSGNDIISFRFCTQHRVHFLKVNTICSFNIKIKIILEIQGQKKKFHFWQTIGKNTHFKLLSVLFYTRTRPCFSKTNYVTFIHCFRFYNRINFP